jgi:hypothetical protein
MCRGRNAWPRGFGLPHTPEALILVAAKMHGLEYSDRIADAGFDLALGADLGSF